jgi:hypothetical protein
MYLLALVFIYFSRIELVRFDKITGCLTQSKFVLFWRLKHDSYPLSDVVKVDLYGAGRKNMHENSVHYKVQIRLRTGHVLKILESKRKTDAYRKALDIKEFLQINEEIELSNNIQVDF